MVLSTLIKAKCRSNAARRRGLSLIPILIGSSFILTAGCSSGNDYGPQVSPAVMVSGAQKSIDQLKANKTMPDSLKNAEIKHLEGEIATVHGQAGPTQSGPPPGLGGTAPKTVKATPSVKK